jgi:hypothetical protein
MEEWYAVKPDDAVCGLDAHLNKHAKATTTAPLNM